MCEPDEMLRALFAREEYYRARARAMTSAQLLLFCIVDWIALNEFALIALIIARRYARTRQDNLLATAARLRKRKHQFVALRRRRRRSESISAGRARSQCSKQTSARAI